MAKLSRPQKADEFELKLPDSFKPPEGVKFDIKADDPLWSQAREWALKHGLSKEAFQEGIALIAGDKIGTQQKVDTARNAEIAKLGAAGQARVTAMNTWLDAMGVGGLKARVFTAADVQAMETLITRFQRQGGAQFNAGGRVPPETPGKVTDAEYDKMNYSERKAYAERHSANGGGVAP